MNFKVTKHNTQAAINVGMGRRKYSSVGFQSTPMTTTDYSRHVRPQRETHSVTECQKLNWTRQTLTSCDVYSDEYRVFLSTVAVSRNNNTDGVTAHSAKQLFSPRRYQEQRMPTVCALSHTYMPAEARARRQLNGIVKFDTLGLPGGSDTSSNFTTARSLDPALQSAVFTAARSYIEHRVQPDLSLFVGTTTREDSTCQTSTQR